MLDFVSSATKLVFTRPRRAILLLRMAFWVAALTLLVKLFSLPRALGLIAPASAVESMPDQQSEQELATAIDALLDLNVPVFRPICWKRAAVLHRYLTLRGRSTTINFGLRKGPGGALDGHAWLEADGQPIFESRPPNYTVTYVFPSNAPCEIELASLAKSRAT
jgi:hypothetical protein